MPSSNGHILMSTSTPLLVRYFLNPVEISQLMNNRNYKVPYDIPILYRCDGSDKSSLQSRGGLRYTDSTRGAISVWGLARC